MDNREFSVQDHWNAIENILIITIGELSESRAN